jgi:hypothetical protein
MSIFPRSVSKLGGHLVVAQTPSADIRSKTLWNNPGTKSGWHIILNNTDIVGNIYIQESSDENLLEDNWVNVVFSDGTNKIPVSSGINVVAFRHVVSFANRLRLFFDWTSGSIGQLDVYLTKTTENVYVIKAKDNE